jgi:hypothetical protein
MYSYICTTYNQMILQASYSKINTNYIHENKCGGISSSFRHNLQEAYWLRYQYLRIF